MEKGRLLEAPKVLSFPEGTPEIALHFQGIRFRIGGAGQMRYSHRLVRHGSAKEWSDFRPDNKVAYRGLPAGEYRFEVRARDRDDLVSAWKCRWSEAKRWPASRAWRRSGQ